MAYTTIAWQESIDPAAAYVNITAVPDPHIRTAGDYIYVNVMRYFLGAIVALEGTADLGAYLGSPSLRRVVNLDLMPWTAGLAPLEDNFPVWQPDNPVELQEDEGMEVLINSNPGAATVQTVAVQLGDGPVTPPAGEIFHVRFTTAITETVGAWVNGPITLRQTLPVGRYACVGGLIQGTSPAAWRFVPVGAFNRPGGMGTTDLTLKGPALQRNGGMGVWFEFDSTTPPTVDWLANATAGTAQCGIMDLIKIA